MEFKIEFRSSKGYAVNRKTRKIGINQIDAIRKDLGVNLSIERITADWYGISKDPTVKISEAIARESGHFDEINEITVRVDDSHLNKFVHRKTMYERDEETGEIKKAWCVWEIDTDAIVDEWAEADFQLDWQTRVE